jgi:hypothetical protein
VAIAAGGGTHRTRRDRTHRGVDARRHNARESGVDNVFHHGTVFGVGVGVAFVRSFGRARARWRVDGWMDRDRIERGRMDDGWMTRGVDAWWRREGDNAWREETDGAM